MEAIQAAFKLEIANPFTTTATTLTVALSDGGHAVIGATLVSPTVHTTSQTPSPSTHTYHYRHQHDFDGADNQPMQRLLLRNIADCRSYLDDVCHTFLAGTWRDNEVTFPDGTVYLITIAAA